MRTIGFGTVEGCSIFMDEETDSYFSISPELEGEVEEVLEKGGFTSPADRLHAALGLADEPVRIVRADFAVATSSVLDGQGPPSARFADVFKAALLLRGMRRMLGSRPIHSLLAEKFARPSAPIDDKALIDRVSRFLAARRLVPIKRNCLLDSLSLVRWVGPARVSMLFGVKLNPFAAHCWVQSGALILNDLTENVAAFTVIRVV